MRRTGPETRKNHEEREAMGFYSRFMSGRGVDVGYGGGSRETVLESAEGYDKDTRGYDGLHLPYEDGELDYVYSSHCLEHIPVDKVNETLREWFRVLKIGGHMIICLPHQYLYEKKVSLPSKWNQDHKRFYTPGLTLMVIEHALTPNHWRLRHMRDVDTNYDYSIGPAHHPVGSVDIECVIQKIQPPAWGLV